jgi:hypothetical protein
VVIERRVLGNMPLACPMERFAYGEVAEEDGVGRTVASQTELVGPALSGPHLSGRDAEGAGAAANRGAHRGRRGPCAERASWHQKVCVARAGQAANGGARRQLVGKNPGGKAREGDGATTKDWEKSHGRAERELPLSGGPQWRGGSVRTRVGSG